jgi:hypothetical protein
MTAVLYALHQPPRRAAAWGAASLIAAYVHSGRIEEARAVIADFDPRQAGVFKTGAWGPKLTAMIREALKLASWVDPPAAYEAAVSPTPTPAAKG